MTSNPPIESSVRQGAWRDEEFTPWMIDLPAEEFVMGENAADKFANDTERPAHRVRFQDAFALGKFPVTVEEFHCFRPKHLPNDDGDLPVANVSWKDAVAYCEWLTKKTMRDYRLPSESEWEFACRANSRMPFSFGEIISIKSANFLFDENGLRVGIGHRTSVEAYLPNRFGFHDFHGNVCEWVADTWHLDYSGAPGDGLAWVNVKDNCYVIRGGAWDYLPSLLRSSWRDWRPADFHADNLGFRVAARGPKEFTGK
jgi:formylglycine-generating enzyme required for sulfatase activity